MPYSKTISKYARKGMRVAETAAKALAIAEQAAAVLNSEPRYKDHLINVTPTWTATVGTFQNPQTTERDGDQVRLKSLQLKGRIVRSQASSANCIVRLIVYLDYQSNVSTPSDVLNTDLNSTVNSPLSNFEFDTRGRYRVLYDRTWDLEPNDDDKLMYFTKNFSRKSKVIQRFLEGSNTVAKNNLRYLVVSSEEINAPSITLNSRLVWYDN